MTERFGFFKTFENFLADAAVHSGGFPFFGAGCRNLLPNYHVMTVFANKRIRETFAANGAGMLRISALGASRFNNCFKICVLMNTDDGERKNNSKKREKEQNKNTVFSFFHVLPLR